MGFIWSLIIGWLGMRGSGRDHWQHYRWVKKVVIHTRTI